MGNSAYFRDLLLQRTLLDLDDGPWMSLHTADPGNDGASEVKGGNYERQRLSLVRTAPGTAANDNEISFDGMPAVKVVFFGIWDSQTSGRFLTGGTLLSPVELGAGQALRYRETDLVLRLG